MMDKSMLKLAVNSVSVRYHNRLVLDQVSCHVGIGELVTVIGPNGAGKSTLLHALSDDSPRSQSVLGNRPLSAYSALERAQKIAVLTQQHQLPFAFTVRELVAMGRYPFATGQALDEQFVTHALVATDMLALQHSDYTQLSGGEQQRAQLARALAQVWPEGSHQEGRFLLLDEPTTGLDLHHQTTILDYLKQLTTNGVGIVMVTHDINLASQYADRIVILNHGAVHAQGAPQELINAATITPVFGQQLAFVKANHVGHFIVPLKG